MKYIYLLSIYFLFFLAAQQVWAQEPIVYLPLDSTLNDASGNGLNATDAGTEPAQFINDSQRGMVAKFPVAAHAQFPLDPKLDFGTGDFSVAFWIKVDTTTIPGSDPAIFTNKDWGSGGNPGFLVALDGADDPGTHQWTVNVADGTSRLDWDADDNQTQTLVDGKWHFVAVAFDRDATMNVYFDGELKQTDPAEDSKNLTLVPGDLSPDNLPLTLMQDATGVYGSDFEGFLDDVLVYNRVVTPDEVSNIFANGYSKNPALGADVYLPLDSTLNDASGNGLNATDAGTEPTTFVQDSERGMVANFPTAAHAQFPLDPKLDFGTEDFTIAFWVKIDTTTIPGSDPAIFTNKDWGSGGNPGFLVALDGADDPGAHQWTVNVADGTSRLDWDADDNQTQTLVDGKWHFVAVAFDRDATMNVYFDGELKQTDPAEDSKNLTLVPGDLSPDNLPLTLMQDATGVYGSDFAAMLDDVRVWKGKALSAEAVMEAFTFSVGIPGGDETYGADVYLPLDTTLNDESGNGVHATDAGAEPTVFVEDEMRGQVAEFPIAAHAQFPEGNPFLDFGTENFSVAFWIKIDPNLPIPSDPVIIGNKDWGSGGNPGFLVALDGADDPAAHLWTVNASDGAGGRLDWDADDNATPNLKDGHWHLVAVAFDRATTMNVYFDGELKQSDPADDSKNLTLIAGSLSTTLPFTLMQDATGAYGSDFAAMLDNVRIWKGTAISAEVVATIFAEDKGNGDGGGGGIVLGTEPLVNNPEVLKVYPNPVRGEQAFFTVQVATPTDVSLTIYDQLGNVIQSVAHKKVAAGAHTLTWDTSAYKSGLYFYHLQGAGLLKSGRVLLMK